MFGDESAEVELMSFKRRHEIQESEIHVDFADAIWMVLKDVSGGGRRMITPEGEMHEWQQ